MIPNTAVAFLAFIILIVPGITFELLRQTRRPALEQTSLEELARIVLSSVALMTVAGGILVALGTLVHGFVIDPRELAFKGLAWHWENHPFLLIRTVMLEIASATIIALFIHRSLNHPNGLANRLLRVVSKWLRHEAGEQVERFSVWRTLFRDLRPQGADTKLTIVKKDGTLVSGFVAAYSVSSPGDERDIALTQPIEVFRLGDKTPRLLDSGWRILMISSVEISEIFVTWPRRGSERFI